MPNSERMTARRGKWCLGSRSHDRSVSVFGRHPRPTTSGLIFKAMVVLVMSDPVLDGAPVAACQLSHAVVVQAQRVKSENGGSLDETEAGSL